MSLLLRPHALFKRAQNALESAVHTNDHDEAVLKQSTVWMKSITWALIGTAGFGLVWITFAQTEEIVQATGRLQPVGSVKDIQLPVGGVAKQILVKDGQRVSAGQPLMRLDTEANAAQQKGILNSIRLKQGQLALKRMEIRRYLEINTKESEIFRDRLQLDEQVLSRFSRLYRQGATAELQYLQQKNRVAEIRGQLEQSLLERSRQVAILEQAANQLSTDLQSLQSQLAQANQTLSYQLIKAPVSGVVFDLKPKVVGYSAQSTETVMKIVPFDQLEARVEIPTENIGFVRVGMPADISIDSFPATDFGVLLGTVRKIGSDALPPDPAKQRDQYRYSADIRLNSQRLILKNGRALPLQVGMSVVANIKLRKVSYLQLLLGGFRDKADALRRI